ncbi:hypothetical protein [Streptosporangium saharense]
MGIKRRRAAPPHGPPPERAAWAPVSADGGTTGRPPHRPRAVPDHRPPQ